MNYLKAFTALAVTVSLIINFILLTKVNDLKNKVNSISSFQQHLNNNVNSQTGNINNIINEMKREQSWLSTVTTNFDTSQLSQGKANINFQWQVKELQKGSKVVFNYKYGSEKEYTTVIVAEKNNGLYEANIPITVSLEPEWEVMVRDTVIRASEISKRAVEEVKKADYSNDTINYFITSSYNDVVKSGEINTTYIGNLGYRYYGNLQASLNLNDNSSYNVSVAASKYDDITAVSLKEIYLKKYRNEQLLSEEILISNDIKTNSGMPVREHSAVFYTKPSNEKLDNTRLVIKAVFSDGKVFEKEVYSR